MFARGMSGRVQRHARYWTASWLQAEFDPVTASAPYDRALALASLVRTMRDHYLAVRCICGAARVIAVGQMARDRRLVDRTLAHVALRLS